MTSAKLALVFGAWTCALFAQSAQISGLIQDPSTLKIGGAEVTIRNQQTGGKRSTRSNESGFYSLPSLIPGVYRVMVGAGTT